MFEKIQGKRNIGKVKLYALSTCIWCRKTKAILDRSEVDYEYVYVDELDADKQARMREEARKLAGKILFPVVVINENVIVGWRESELKEALGP